MSAQVADSESFDFARLERVVNDLLADQGRLKSENESMRRELLERDRVIQELDQRVTLQDQRRTDALKRVDDLVAHVEGFATLAAQMAGR